MRRDLKTGMLIGIVPVIIIFAVISVWPGATIESRLQQSGTFNPDEPTYKTTKITPALSEHSVGEQAEPAATISPQAEQTNPAATQPIPSEPQRLPTESAAAKKPRFHVVAHGETLSGISLKYYGDTRDWKKIYDANRATIKDVSRLHPGMRLIIPE